MKVELYELPKMQRFQRKATEQSDARHAIIANLLSGFGVEFRIARGGESGLRGNQQPVHT